VSGVGILLFVFGLLLIIMIHEAGHFLVAKRFNFKATRFFLGFGPTLWSTTRGETEYGIKALPLGGFVKIVGMNPYEELAPEDQARAYPNKPRYQRALMILGGPATHWITAFIVLSLMAPTVGFFEIAPEVSRVQQTLSGEETPAAQLGLLEGDRIVSVDDVETKLWADFSEYVKAHPGEVVEVKIERDGRTITKTARLGTAIFDEDAGPVAYAPPGEELRDLKPGEEYVGFFGIAPTGRFVKSSWAGAVVAGGQRTWSYTAGAAVTIWNFFGDKIFGGELVQSLRERGERGADEPVGLVGIGRIASETAARGLYAQLLEMMVALTLIIGLMNMLPLPPLDGGHLAVLGYELITRRPVDMRKLIPVSAAVVSFFLLLFAAILYLDLTRPVNAF
jgi:membrane-associated protease RseP (regulator of RpoE activity)